MELSNIWKYLDNVWIMTGLVLIMLISLLRMLSNNNLNNQKKKQQMQKGINYLFVLGLTGMVLVSLFSHKNNPVSLQQADADLLDSASFPSQDYIDAKSQAIGNGSDTGGSAGFNQLFHVLPDRTRSERPNTVSPQSKEYLDAAINHDEDIYIEAK